jgi:hypothetical protein
MPLPTFETLIKRAIAAGPDGCVHPMFQAEREQHTAARYLWQATHDRALLDAVEAALIDGTDPLAPLQRSVVNALATVQLHERLARPA